MDIGFATICWACHGLDVVLAVSLPSVVFFFENLWACLALLQIFFFFFCLKKI